MIENMVADNEMIYLGDKLMKRYSRAILIEPVFYLLPWAILWNIRYGGLTWLLTIGGLVALVGYLAFVRPTKYFKEFLFSLDDYNVPTDDRYTCLGTKILDIHSDSMMYDIFILDGASLCFVLAFMAIHSLGLSYFLLLLVIIPIAIIVPIYWFSSYSTIYTKRILFNYKLE